MYDDSNSSNKYSCGMLNESKNVGWAALSKFRDDLESQPSDLCVLPGMITGKNLNFFTKIGCGKCKIILTI